MCYKQGLTSTLKLFQNSMFETKMILFDIHSQRMESHVL